MKKVLFTKLLFIVAFSTGLLFSLQAQISINEIQEGGSVEIKNYGNTTVDISSYILCDFPAYWDLDSDFTVVCGDLNLAAGEIVSLIPASGVNVALPSDDGELGLYINSSFGNPNSIIDYFEWGSTGHTRSSVAVAAGIWTAGDFIPSFLPNQSLSYDGLGDSSANFYPENNPSFCSENMSNCTVDGGSIALPNGDTSTSICVDGNPDPLQVNVSNSSGPNGGWIITDDVDNILAVPASPPFDLDPAGEGTCFIWYIRYEDGLAGMTVGNNLSDLAGCFDLSNGIEVIREIPDGGSVSLTDGSDSFAQCAGNIVFDVQHTTTAPNLSYWYIITDNNDNILAFQNSNAGPTIDLSGAPAGECRVWGWNYRGLDDPIVGDNISTLTDDFCEDISDNFITVYREIPDGGSVTLADGSDSFAQCAGNIVFDVQHTTTAPNISYWYIITDNNDNILAFQNSTAGPTIDLSGAPAGECRVWGWNYRGLDDPIVGDNISTLTDDFCEDISDNFITVYREIPDGGSVTLADGSDSFEGCAGDIVFDVQHTTTAPNISYWYIITDNSDNILAFQNSTAGSTLDLSGAPVGECRVWGWNYRGLDDPIVGDNISTLTDDFCEDISDNFITVLRRDSSSPECITSSTEDLNNLKYTIDAYPNPTSDVLFLEFSSTEDINAEILIYNDLGQLVLQTSKEIKNNKVELDVRDLQNGLLRVIVFNSKIQQNVSILKI